MCVGDCDRHGKGFARKVGRLRGRDDHTESSVGDVIFGHDIVPPRVEESRWLRPSTKGTLERDT